MEKFQFFGSSSERFKDGRRITSIGPSDYNPSNVHLVGRATHVKFAVAVWRICYSDDCLVHLF
jgi:hypothetical protein